VTFLLKFEQAGEANVVNVTGIEDALAFVTHADRPLDNPTLHYVPRQTYCTLLPGLSVDCGLRSWTANGNGRRTIPCGSIPRSSRNTKAVNKVGTLINRETARSIRGDALLAFGCDHSPGILDCKPLTH